MTGATDRFVLDIVTTLDDQIAFNLHMMNTPPLSTMRRRRELAALASAPLWFAGGLLLAWLLDTTRQPFRAFLGFVLQHPALLLGGPAFAFAAMILGVLINRVLARRRVVAFVRRTLRDSRDVDPEDSSLSHRTRAIFDETGVTSETTLGHSVTKWAAIQRLDETDRYLFLVSGPFSGFMVPKRQLDAHTLEGLRVLIVASLERERA